MSFVDRFVNPDISNDRGGASSAMQQGNGGQGNASAIPLGRPRQSSSRNSSDDSTSNVSNRKNVKPATYDGKSSWLDFKSHFEICAQLCNILNKAAHHAVVNPRFIYNIHAITCTHL